MIIGEESVDLKQGNAELKIQDETEKISKITYLFLI